MVKLSKTKFNEIKSLIELSYEGDTDLFEKFYIHPNMTYEDCVNFQMIQIKQADAEVPLNYFKALYNDKPIGYAITFYDVLFSFCLNKNFRKEVIKKSFFESICKELPQKFACVLYKQNERAIGWLKKNGMLISENEIDNNAVTLVKI